MDETNTATAAKPAAPRGATRALALPDRFHWLDFLRFLAAMAVVLHHYYFLYFDGMQRLTSEGEMIANFPFAGMLFFYDYGQYAVEFFWVLSGFVFAHTYFRRPSDGIGFAAARFARLYPLHFATLIAITVLQTVSTATTGTSQVIGDNDAFHFLLQLFFVSAWGLTDGDSFNAPIWSVSAEIATYMLFFVLHRNGLFRTAAGQATAMLAAIAVAAALGSRAVPVCAAFFFAGCFAYTLIEKRRAVDFVLAAILILLASRFPEALKLLKTPMTVPLATFSLIVFLVAWLDILRLPGGRLIGHLGDFTYSVYLLHFPMIVATLIVFDVAGIVDRSFLASPVALTLYLAAVLAAAASCYHSYERPAARRIRRWVKERRAVLKTVETEARAA